MVITSPTAVDDVPVRLAADVVAGEIKPPGSGSTENADFNPGGDSMLSNAIVDDQAQQQLLALQQANRVRVARAELKRRIANDEVSVAQVVVECPWEAASMEIGDLIRSQRRWGAARCRRLLVSVGLPENKHVGTLTDRQRKVLAAVLETAPAGGRDAPAPALGAPTAPASRRQVGAA